MRQKKTSFFKEVYDIVMKIPAGKVMTYGQIAKIIGRPTSSRAVGWALHANKYPEKVPCYRVVSKHGKLSSSFVYGGIEGQRNALKNDNTPFLNYDTVDLEKCFCRKNMDC